MARKIILLQLLFLFFVFNAAAQNDSTHSELKFDLGLTRDKNVNLWPILKYSQTEVKKEFQLFSPLIKSTRNYSPLKKHFHFLPFLISDSSTQNKDFRFLSTYYPSLLRWYRDYQEQIKSFRFLELAPHINMLEFSKSKDGLFIQNNLLFFLWYKNDMAQKKSHFIVFPFYWAFHSPFRSTNSFLPIYSYGKLDSGSGRYFAITPLYWNIQKQDVHRSTLFPFFWKKETDYANQITTKVKILPLYWSAKDNRVQKTVLFPVYWSRSTPEEKNKILFPFLWSLNSPDYKSFTFLPLFSYGNSFDKNELHVALTPLFLHTQSQGNISNMLFPVWWYRRTGFGKDKEETNIIVPFWLTHKTADTKTGILFPFHWKFQNPMYKSTTLFPVYSKGCSPDSINQHLIASPLFWQFKSFQYKSSTFFPIFWHKKSGYASTLKTTNVVFPLYYSNTSQMKQNKIVFPLVYYNQNPNYISFTCLPLFSFGHDSLKQKKHTILSPLFWHFSDNNTHSNTFFPFWWNNKTMYGEKSQISNVLFPFYWSYKDSSKTNYTILPIYSKGTYNNKKNRYLAVTPFYWKFWTADGNESLFFLFWYNKQTKENNSIKKTQIGFPLYWSYRNGENKTTILFPFSLNHQNKQYKDYLFFPIIFKHSSIDELNKFTAVTPVIWKRKSPDFTSTTIFPIWRHKQRFFSSDTSHSTILFPIIWTYKDKTRSNSIVFPVLWKFRTSEHHSFTFFPLFSSGYSAQGSKHYIAVTPLIWNRKSADYRSNTIFPIWWSKKRYFESDTSRSNVLFPIVWSYRNNLKKALTVFPFWWSRIYKNDSIYNHTKFLFPLYWNEKNPSCCNHIFFPLVWSLKNRNYTSFTALPFLSFGKSPDNRKNHLVITPIAWHIKTLVSTRTCIVPLFNSYAQNIGRYNFDLFYILFRYKRINTYKSFQFLWPLCQYENDSLLRYFRFAPIIWYKKTADYRFFSIQPIFYMQESTLSNEFHLFWQLYVSQNYYGLKKSRRIGWRAIWWDRYDNGDREFRLFHLLFANMKKKGQVEKSLFPFYHIKKDAKGNRSVAILFYFYHYFKRQIPESGKFYQEEKIFWFIRLRSNYDTISLEK